MRKHGKEDRWGKCCWTAAAQTAAATECGAGAAAHRWGEAASGYRVRYTGGRRGPGRKEWGAAHVERRVRMSIIRT